MSDTVQQIKDKISIVDIVSQYVKLERSGGNLRARCPFHAEKSPSFFVSPDRGTYHCFGCGVGGDIFSFVEAIEGLDFKGALRVLADKAGIELVYERGGKEKKDERERLFELMETATIFYAGKLDEKGIKYLHDRGVVDATIQTFRLGWAGDQWNEICGFLRSKKFTDAEILNAGLARKGDRGLLDKFRNRIMFPIADSAGRIVGFSGRIFGENASPEAPKYLNSPETPLFHKSRILYGFDKAKLSIRKHNCAVLVEGQMDLLASHQAGWGNTVAVSGTAFTPEHAQLIKRMTDNLVLALDGDEAGIKAAGRAARAALQGGLNVKVAKLEEGMDPADLIQKEGKDAWSLAIKNAKDIITFLMDVLEEHAKNPDQFRRTVEMVVLPFLSDVQSPIAREQHVKEIAKRLGVSEKAVNQALENQPRVQAPAERGTTTSAAQKEELSRERHAYAILLWQKSLAKPLIDIKKYQKDLEETIDASDFELFTKMSDSEKEILRFSAERLYGGSTTLDRDVKLLLKILLKVRLSRELAQISTDIKKAEAGQNDAEVKRLMGVNKMLTTRIANINVEV